MKNKLNIGLGLLLIASTYQSGLAQIAPGTAVIRPVESHEVLNNPGIGFTTFQRFNGDDLNPGAGWTEGFPIEYQEFGDLTNKNHPQTTIAYFRVYWKFFEPEKEKYNWQMIDKALATAESRGQTLMLRIAPYGTGSERDVPAWYREMVGNKKDWKYNSEVNGWVVDPEDPRYVQYFGGMIANLGKRYDGHPFMNAVDLSFIGAWGEGGGSEFLSQNTMEALVDAYTDNFKKTPLIALLMDEKTNKYAHAKGNGNVGWRVDCIGDLGFWAKDQNGWTHMYDFYPQAIIEYGTKDAWQTAPISLEICGTFLRWRDQEHYNMDQVKYIFDQSLKWHISSFNAKSSPVPPEWEPLVNDWLKKMGYRFVLRRFTYPQTIKRNSKLHFESWWENKGVAPCYQNFPLAIRLKNQKEQTIFPTSANIRTWLPGDNVYNDAITIPKDLKAGVYEIQLALTDPLTNKPKVLLAIEGKDMEGWYTMGKITVE
ncbi:MAG: DUF4832 domain-containing protein [Cyclobacteriaceae bacterium]